MRVSICHVPCKCSFGLYIVGVENSRTLQSCIEISAYLIAEVKMVIEKHFCFFKNENNESVFG